MTHSEPPTLTGPISLVRDALLLSVVESLEANGRFRPFGVQLLPGGQPRLVVGDPEVASSPDATLRLITLGFQSQAHPEMWVGTASEGIENGRDAIILHLEERGGDALVESLLYEISTDTGKYIVSLGTSHWATPDSRVW